MTAAVDEPLLHHHSPGLVACDRAGIGPARGRSGLYALHTVTAVGLRLDDLCRIRRMDDVIRIAMEDDGPRADGVIGARTAFSLAGATRDRRASPQTRTRRQWLTGKAGRNGRRRRRKPRDRSLPSRRHGASGGETGHEHALRIESYSATISLVIPAMMEGSPAPRTLILRLEPVPAEGWIGALALAWIGDEKSMLLGQRIHAGPCREVVGILRAAMQHDDQWAAPPA